MKRFDKKDAEDGCLFYGDGDVCCVAVCYSNCGNIVLSFRCEHYNYRFTKRKLGYRIRMYLVFVGCLFEF